MVQAVKVRERRAYSLKEKSHERSGYVVRYTSYRSLLYKKYKKECHVCRTEWGKAAGGQATARVGEVLII